MTFCLMYRPPRETFVQDATDEERAIVGQHFHHVMSLQEGGRLRYVGRAEDGAYGLVVFDAESIEEAQSFALADPMVRANLFSQEVRTFIPIFP